jgi:hypothetical protein
VLPTALAIAGVVPPELRIRRCIEVWSPVDRDWRQAWSRWSSARALWVADHDLGHQGYRTWPPELPKAGGAPWAFTAVSAEERADRIGRAGLAADWTPGSSVDAAHAWFARSFNSHQSVKASVREGRS